MTSSITIKPSEIASNGGTNRASLKAMNSFRHAFALIAAALLCFASLLNAASPATNAVPRPQPGRWLLIVDTSSGMEKRAEAVRGIAGELLLSGMNGQMNAGDEFGIWTYNKKLSAGVAPMQVWDAARSNIIAGRTVGFLSKQSYTGKAKPSLVFAELEPIVSNSRQLTVVMLSDGAVDIAGTPYDAAINAAYAENRPLLKQSRMPLVTVLRGYKGQYMAHQVVLAPWIGEFPAFPVEPTKTNAAPIAVAAAPKLEPKRTIIIRAEPKKIEPETASVALQPGAVSLRNPPEPALVEPMPVPASVNPVPVVTPVEAVPIVKVEPAPVVPIAQTPKVNTPEPAPVALTVQAGQLVAPPEPAPAPAPVIASTPLAAPLQSASTANGDVTARKWPLILGIAFMWAAIVVALLLARRARRANATSLITRSFDQK